jgi:hypothetical protein
VNYQNDPIAQRLYAFLVRWVREHPDWAYEAQGWTMGLRNVGSVGDSLLDEAEFGEIKLAGWLKSPDGELIQTVVGWILPWPASAEFKLLVDAVTLAAQAKQKNERGVAAGLTLVGAVLLFFILFSE